MNEAMFVGSPGWVAKPRHMRTGDPEETKPSGGREKLVGEIVGVSSCASFLLLFASTSELNECFLVPAPNGRAGKTFSTYVRAQLLHASGDLEWRSKSIKTQHSVETGANVTWQSQFEWEYENDEMAFLRYVPSFDPFSDPSLSLFSLVVDC